MIAWTGTNLIIGFAVVSIADITSVDSNECARALEVKGMRYAAGVM